MRKELLPKNDCMESLREGNLATMKHFFGSIQHNGTEFIFINHDLGEKRREAVSVNDKMNRMGWQKIWNLDIENGEVVLARIKTDYMEAKDNIEQYFSPYMDMLNRSVFVAPTNFLKFTVVDENGAETEYRFDSLEEFRCYWISFELCKPKTTDRIRDLRINYEYISCETVGEMIEHMVHMALTEK